MMRSISINKKIVRIVEKLYGKSICAVIVHGLLIEWISANVGFKQACLLSPTLFTLFLHFVMDEIKSFFTLGDDLNFDARYADGSTLIAAVFERLQLANVQLRESCKKYKTKINTEKWKVICDSTTNLTITNKVIETVKEFKFLGSLVPNSSHKVKRKIALADSAFDRL